MKISGFTFVRNAVKLYYPIVEAISSILPICYEFVIATGDSEDETTDLIRSIGSDKTIVIETVWDSKYFVGGAINVQQTNVALSRCTGDWCFYLQADEVVHEKYLLGLTKKMEKYLNDPQVEGFLFSYKHFYGDYDHYQTAHNWYSHEIRIVRNGIGVESWGDAQGFRRNGQKLKVAKSDAEIFHYGWVRPPSKMTQKQAALASLYKDSKWVDLRYPDKTAEYDFGKLKTLSRFTGSHPQVMQKRIAERDWEVLPSDNIREKHDRFSVRLFSFIENRVLKRRIGEYKNYVLIDR